MMERFNEICRKAYVGLQLVKSESNETLNNEKGQAAVEYALVIAVIVVGVIAASAMFYEPLGEFFTAVKDRIMSFF